jgi:ubiquinone/menaquinone biosynthesis C-methylase UbiE
MSCEPVLTGLIVMNDHARKDYRYHQAIADEYDKVVVEPRQVTNRLLFRHFASGIGSGGQMLDLGCGTGHMSLRFGNRFERVTAVDHSDAMLSRARSKLPERVELVRADVLEFTQRCPPATADLICCTGFLHHLRPQVFAPFLATLRRILKPDGRLLISEPIEVHGERVPEPIERWNRDSLAVRLHYSAADLEDPDEAPLQPGYLVDNLAQAGLEILETRRNWEIFPHRSPPSWIDRAYIYWLMRRFPSGNVFTLLARPER